MRVIYCGGKKRCDPKKVLNSSSTLSNDWLKQHDDRLSVRKYPPPLKLDGVVLKKTRN